MDTTTTGTGAVPARPGPPPVPPARRGSLARVRALLAGHLAWLRRDAGMNTAEYAVGTLAAVAFAGLLLKVLTSAAVQQALTSIIQRALR